MNKPNPAKRLRATMKKHGLTNAKTADLLGVSVKTVESWVSSPKSASHRNMPERHLKLLDAVLPEYLLRNPAA